jgi:ankyrin repeat protein
MQIAARNGNLPLMEALFAVGAVLTSRGQHGDTLVHLAALNGHPKVIQWLQDRGCPPEAVDARGQTALHVAARRGELQTTYITDNIKYGAQYTAYNIHYKQHTPYSTQHTVYIIHST